MTTSNERPRTSTPPHRAAGADAREVQRDRDEARQLEERDVEWSERQRGEMQQQRDGEQDSTDYRGHPGLLSDVATAVWRVNDLRAARAPRGCRCVNGPSSF